MRMTSSQAPEYHRGKPESETLSNVGGHRFLLRTYLGEINMNDLSRRLTAVLGVVALAVILSPVAKADDYKVFPGAACERENPTNYGNGATPLYSYLYGVYQNKSTDLRMGGSQGGWEHLLCPITRDQFRNTSGLKNLLVRFYNSGTGGRGVRCDLAAYNKFGGANVAGQPGSTLSFQAVTVTATGVGEAALKVNVGVLGGYYILHCEIPPGGYLYSYQIQEVPNTNDN
jgi:hypothetical protein